jgi:hypothetical protein
LVRAFARPDVQGGLRFGFGLGGRPDGVGEGRVMARDEVVHHQCGEVGDGECDGGAEGVHVSPLRNSARQVEGYVSSLR